MGKVLVWIAAVAAGVWLLLWMGTAVIAHSMAGRDDTAWPLGLGRSSEVLRRFPSAPASVGAVRLAALARPMGLELTPRAMSAPPDARQQTFAVRGELNQHVTRQIQRANPVIDPLPETLTAFFKAHDADMARLRALILSDELMAWAQDIESPSASPIPRLSGHMTLTRVFVARALDLARREDGAAWEDLRAAWAVNRNLLERPEIISVLVGIASARTVNAAARKMPLPAPEWLGELQRFDYRRATLAAHQAEAWSMSQRIRDEVSVDEDVNDPASGVARRIRERLLAPYTRLCMLDELERWRAIAIEIAAATECDLDLGAVAQRRRAAIPWWNLPARDMPVPNVASMWQRLLRFRAEIEATERALDLRAGRPPRRHSACSDGHWEYSAGGLRFSRRLAPPEIPAAAIPVEFWLTR
ncbi:MAG TPA: hypothetical protein VMS98_17900 [Thermoanaerobaculia bacterium]|nr:hypothetical protein [Thermoanaerobaculia bacterium]